MGRVSDGRLRRLQQSIAWEVGSGPGRGPTAGIRSCATPYAPEIAMTAPTESRGRCPLPGPSGLKQGHHSLMDGLHVGRYFGRIQDYFAQPERFAG